MTDLNRQSIALPTDISAEISSKTQEQSAIMALARQITLPGRGLTIPIITGDSEASWVAETGKKPVSNSTLDKKIMQAYKLAVIETFSMEFVRDLPALYNELVKRLPAALAKKFDATVFGAGSAPGENFDTFKAVTAQEIGTDAYKGLVGADADIAEHGGIMNGIVLAPQAKSVLLSAVDGNKRPLFINSVTWS
ncbi:MULTISPECIES: phage major capsid protein [Terrabacteria group]|uniref:phage major capsid protein n=1 Tax=Bacillati TaxID=1783272 RepID=UPI001C6EAA4D|nr:MULTISPECIES: phage major capsid protein [Terrabacteria group]MBW9212982.1 phage major capsid protein [Trueperella sp. zg.1013]